MPVKKLLIVDDSAFMRKVLRDIINDIPGVVVVGIARNGLDALEVIPKLKPDIITLDIEMPELNGIETLKQIKLNFNLPVIMLSSLSGSEITIEALQLGAEDFIVKPTDLRSNLSEFKLELQIKINSVVNIKPVRRFNERMPIPSTTISAKEISAVVIGASTGGPRALSYIVNRLPENISSPIFIVQHMPKEFTASFASRLNKESNIEVLEAEDNLVINKGVVYIAPGDYHMVIKGNRIRLLSEEKLHGVRPAVDYLFASAADVYRDKLLAIILTGMGKDGTEGMLKIKKAGGYNIAQNEETCVIYGMPKNAVENGAVHGIMSLGNISMNLNNLVMEN